MAQSRASQHPEGMDLSAFLAQLGLYLASWQATTLLIGEYLRLLLRDFRDELGDLLLVAGGLRAQWLLAERRACKSGGTEAGEEEFVGFVHAGLFSGKGARRPEKFINQWHRPC